jgi:heme/copper-type cytochrome/quinol oxidase subunit 2
VLGVLLALSNGFWLQSLQGAVGYIERGQHPFHTWLLDVALLFPVFVLGVLAVWAVARRRYRDLSAPRAVVVTGLALTAVATLISVAALIANSAYDYHLQSNQLRLAQATHSTALSGESSHAEHGEGLVPQRQTLQTHVKGVELTSGLVLGTNLILIAWVIAARGGRLERAPRDRRLGSATEPESPGVA